jgi:hypothetical protein
MKKEEIDEFMEDKFKKIARYFHKAIENFETEDILNFRKAIKKLKVFLHLINMESGDGFSYRITKRMKTIYGYLGIIQNLQLQLKQTDEFVKNSSADIPVQYVQMVEKELAFWKKNVRDFLDAGYDFYNDKTEILATLPGKLTKKSILKFIRYTLFELQSLSGNSDDYILESTRKFIEDIYYNYEIIKPFISNQQNNLFNKTVLEECLNLFGNFREKCIAVALLQTIHPDESEKKLLKYMENDWLQEKKNLKDQLSVKLDSMHIKTNNLSAFAYADLLNE